MARPKKDAKILNIKLSIPVNNKLEAFCEESGLSKTVTAEKVLDQYLDKYFSKPESERKL